jgi:putative zinc finger protein
VTTAETRASCLDPEVLAAWMDGTLSRDELASAEAHVATCARCQAMLAVMAKTTPAPATPKRSWRRFLVPVLVPATAVAAVAIWLARPQLVVQVEPPPAPQMARADESDRALRDQAAESVAPQPETNALASAAPVAKEAKTAPRENRESFDARAVPVPSQPAAAFGTQAASPPPPPPAAQPVEAPSPAVSGALRKQLETERQPMALRRETVQLAGQAPGPAALDVIAPEPPRGWRLNNDRIERSIDGVWTVVYSEPDAGLVALSSPSPDVCWAVGRAGTVLLTTDGRTWRKMPFPKTGDLASVLASDGNNAVVFSAEGSTWVTKNGGQTWEAPKR